MITLKKSLLDRSPEETARYLCLSQLQEAAEALDRLEAGTDPEALHDFRVALRRLRSHIRAYRPYLGGSKPKKLRARIKDLASSTNVARDAEVALEWLEEEGPADGSDAAAGATHLRDALRSKQAETPTADDLRERFEPLRETAQEALSRLELRLSSDPTSFLAATGKLVGDTAAGLERSLDTVERAEDGEKLHRARIVAKRLRYLLEPLQLEVPGTSSLVKSMKSLQDCLGELQDTRVLIDMIAETVERSALEEARRLAGIALGASAPEALEGPVRRSLGEGGPHAGLLELLRIQRARRDRRFQELDAQWLGASGRAFFQELEALAERLSASRTDEAPKRRFLLRARPAPLERAQGVRVRQGWLPGKDVHEQVRSESSGRRVRRSRIVSVDGRPPVEEPLSRARFEAFWPLTEKRRLERRRFRLAVDGRVWYVDEFPDQDLVLAEVEMDGGATVPEPIREVLVREVTGSKKYALESLARSRAPAQASSLGS